MNSERQGYESSTSSQAVGAGLRQEPGPYGVEIKDKTSHSGSGEFLDSSGRGSYQSDLQQFTLIFSQEAQSRFDGTGSPTKANCWLEELRDRITSHNVPQLLHVELAKSFLEGAACEWWKSCERSYQGMFLRIPWIWFEDQFHLYFSNPEHRQIQRKSLIHLRQGKQSVAEYNNRFLFLSRYAPDIVADRYLHCRLYVDGLDQDLIPDVEGPSGLRLNSSAGNVYSLMEQAINADKCRKDTTPPLQQRSDKAKRIRTAPSDQMESTKPVIQPGLVMGLKPWILRPPCCLISEKSHLLKCMHGSPVSCYCHDTGHTTQLCLKKPSTFSDMNVHNKVHTDNLRGKQSADEDGRSSLKDEQHRDTQPPEETKNVIINEQANSMSGTSLTQNKVCLHIFCIFPLSHG
jgi:Retrotransposon gag protein